jgi:hypothetical protein
MGCFWFPGVFSGRPGRAARLKKLARGIYPAFLRALLRAVLLVAGPGLGLGAGAGVLLFVWGWVVLVGLVLWVWVFGWFLRSFLVPVFGSFFWPVGASFFGPWFWAGLGRLAALNMAVFGICFFQTRSCLGADLSGVSAFKHDRVWKVSCPVLFPNMVVFGAVRGRAWRRFLACFLAPFWWPFLVRFFAPVGVAFLVRFCGGAAAGVAPVRCAASFFRRGLVGWRGAGRAGRGAARLCVASCVCAPGAFLAPRLFFLLLFFLVRAALACCGCGRRARCVFFSSGAWRASRAVSCFVF